MPDNGEQNDGQQQPQTPAEGGEEQPQDPQGQQEGQQEQEGQEPDGGSEQDADLPEWARTKLTKANSEAATYRTKLREAEDKLKSAKTPEEVDAIVKQMTDDRVAGERALIAENVALKFQLPPILAKRLAGATREEMEADAKELRASLGISGDEDGLEGGLEPRNPDNDPTDPGELAKKYGSRRRRR